MGCFSELTGLFSRIEVSNRRAVSLALDATISKIAASIISRAKKGAKAFFIGNGGSAGIASHIAVDFLKNGKLAAMAFNDASFLTCISNDLGYESVFSIPLKVLAGRNDTLFAISSSGKSKNILNAVKEAKKKGCQIITLSGFQHNNPLRKLGDINFYVPSESYGYVEITHLAICHCIIDKIMTVRRS